MSFLVISPVIILTVSSISLFQWYNKWNLGTLKASFPWLNMLCFIVKVKLFDFRHFFEFSLLPWLFSLCWCCGSWRPPSLKGRSYTSTRKKTKTQSNRCMTKLSYLDICCCAAGQHIRCSSKYVDYNLRFQNKEWHVCIQFLFPHFRRKKNKTFKTCFISLTDLGSSHISIN